MQIEAIPLRLANSYRIFYKHWLHMTFDANVTNSTATTWQVTSEVLPETVDAPYEVVEHKQVSKDTIKHTGSGWSIRTLGQINHCDSSVHVRWCQILFPAFIFNFGHKALLPTSFLNWITGEKKKSFATNGLKTLQIAIVQTTLLSLISPLCFSP